MVELRRASLDLLYATGRDTLATASGQPPVAITAFEVIEGGPHVLRVAAIGAAMGDYIISLTPGPSDTP